MTDREPVADRVAGEGEVVHVVVTDERPPGSRPVVDLEWLRRLVLGALDELAVTPPLELALTLVDVEAITELNRDHMGHDRPTDVLSFPIDDEPTGSNEWPRLLGDIVICPEVAEANAPDHAGTIQDELALLCVHGLLHLLGHDHGEAGEARVMRDLEASLLATLHRPVGAGTEIP